MSAKMLLQLAAMQFIIWVLYAASAAVALWVCWWVWCNAPRAAEAVLAVWFSMVGGG